MYKWENGSSVQSGLLTGKAWDRTCNWIKDYKIIVNGTEETISLTDSRKYGNYYNSVLPANSGNGTEREAGYNENWKTKNIYDLAGNVWEWTCESSMNSQRYVRGGCYIFSGNSNPVSARITGHPSKSDNNIGFCIRLYIKVPQI